MNYFSCCRKSWLSFTFSVPSPKTVHVHIRGWAFRMLFVRSGRETRRERGKGFSSSFTRLYTFSHLFVLNVCWPSCRGFYCTLVETGYVGRPFSPCNVDCPLAILNNPWYKLWIRLTLMRIRMPIRIRLITLMRIRILILIVCDPDADPYSTFHPDADPDPNPDPSFQIKAQTCHLLIDADPVPDLAYHLMRIRMRILIFIWCGCGSGSRLPKWCGYMRIRMRLRIHNT